MSEKIIIIGAGPAGYTSAIYAARANLSPLLIEGSNPGGQLMITTDVENFPGFPEAITGPDLMMAMRKQAERFGTRFVQGDVESVSFGKRPFILNAGGKEYSADAVIVATGASARWLGIPSESALMGKGVSACATCDGFFFKNQDVLVVGGGDTALEEALYLTNFAKSVRLVHRRDELRASKVMQERVKKHPKITILWNRTVSEILDVKAGKVTGALLKDVKSGMEEKVECSGIFIAIGHEPNTQVFKGALKLDDKGYLVTRQGSTATNIEGVFAAGDVADQIYRQAVTAAGSGCAAAIEAERWLSSQIPLSLEGRGLGRG